MKAEEGCSHKQDGVGGSWHTHRGCCCSAREPRSENSRQVGSLCDSAASELGGLVSPMWPPRSGCSAVIWRGGSSKGSTSSPSGASLLPSTGFL